MLIGRSLGDRVRLTRVQIVTPLEGAALDKFRGTSAAGTIQHSGKEGGL